MPVITKQNRPSLFGPDCVLYTPLSDIAGIQAEGWELGGTPDIVETPYGKGMDFERNDSERLILGGIFDGIDWSSNEISVFALINPESVYNGGNWTLSNTIIAHTLLFYLIINENGLIASRVEGPGNFATGSDMTAYVGQWVHVGFTYSNTDNVHRNFLNGAPDGNGAVFGAMIAGTGGTVVAHINNNRYFDGIIKNIMVFNRRVSDAEALNLYNQIIGAA